MVYKLMPELYFQHYLQEELLIIMYLKMLDIRHNSLRLSPGLVHVHFQYPTALHLYCSNLPNVALFLGLLLCCQILFQAVDC